MGDAESKPSSPIINCTKEVVFELPVYKTITYHYVPTKEKDIGWIDQEEFEPRHKQDSMIVDNDVADYIIKNRLFRSWNIYIISEDELRLIRVRKHLPDYSIFIPLLMFICIFIFMMTFIYGWYYVFGYDICPYILYGSKGIIKCV